MPILSNARHEAFSRELAKGAPASRAYVLAGYKENDGNAATLKGNQRVIDRVAELQAKAVDRTLVTIDSITAELEEARQIAMAKDTTNPSAAVAASLGKAKLHGLLIDKSESSNVHHVVSTELPTDSEWEAEHVTPN